MIQRADLLQSVPLCPLNPSVTSNSTSTSLSVLEDLLQVYTVSLLVSHSHS